MGPIGRFVGTVLPSCLRCPPLGNYFKLQPATNPKPQAPQKLLQTLRPEFQPWLQHRENLCACCPVQLQRHKSIPKVPRLHLSQGLCRGRIGTTRVYGLLFHTMVLVLVYAFVLNLRVLMGCRIATATNIQTTLFAGSSLAAFGFQQIPALGLWVDP